MAKFIPSLLEPKRALVLLSKIVLFFGLWSLLSLQRYRSGQNYLPILIKIPNVAQVKSGEITVFQRSPFGTMAELIPDVADNNVYRQKWPVAVSELIIVTAPDLITEFSSIEVRCGESLAAPSRKLEVETVAATDVPQGSDVRSVAHSLVCRHLQTSLLSVSAKSINWQGDIMLLAVPG